VAFHRERFDVQIYQRKMLEVVKCATKRSLIVLKSKLPTAFIFGRRE